MKGVSKVEGEKVVEDRVASSEGEWTYASVQTLGHTRTSV
jgi:hypothetical protein